MMTMLRAVSVAALLCSTAMGAIAVALPWTASAEGCDPANAGGAADSCANFPPQTWPAAQGMFTSAADSGWVFFVGNGHGCGIGPDGTVGCDGVPSRLPDGTPAQAGQPGPPGFYNCGGLRCPLPPPGANQVIAGPQEPARFAESDVATFTRDVDVVPAGYRIANGAAWCSVGYQGTVDCVTGANGFFVDSYGGVTLENVSG